MDRATTLIAVLALVPALAPVCRAQTLDAQPQLFVSRYERPPMGNRRNWIVRQQYLLLLPDGTVFNGLPEGGISGVTRERLLEEDAKKVGRYTIQGQEMEIQWEQRKKPWKLKAYDFSWERDPRTLFVPTVTLSADRIKGIWVGSGSGMSGGQNSVPMVGLGGSEEYTFRGNGEFVHAHGSKRRGTYRLEGYDLVLQLADGTEERHILFLWPFGSFSISIDEKLYQLLQSRR